MHSQVAFAMIKLEITALFLLLLYPRFVYLLLGRSEAVCTVNIQVKLAYTGEMFSQTVSRIVRFQGTGAENG